MGIVHFPAGDCPAGTHIGAAGLACSAVVVSTGGRVQHWWAFQLPGKALEDPGCPDDPRRLPVRRVSTISTVTGDLAGFGSTNCLPFWKALPLLSPTKRNFFSVPRPPDGGDRDRSSEHCRSGTWNGEKPRPSGSAWPARCSGKGEIGTTA